MSSKLELTIWSHDTGQQIPCFGSCQPTMTWMSNIKAVYYKAMCLCHPLAGVWSVAAILHDLSLQ